MNFIKQQTHIHKEKDVNNVLEIIKNPMNNLYLRVNRNGIINLIIIILYIMD